MSTVLISSKKKLGGKSTSVKGLLAMTVSFVVLISLVCTSCEKQAEKRHYVEIVSKAPEIPVSTVDPHAGIPGFEQMRQGMMQGTSAMPEGIVPPGPAVELAWDLPSGWTESPNKSSMRLATFTAGSGEGSIECSIVSLGGMAGGVKENIRRWMWQVNIAEISDAKFDEFIAQQEQITTLGKFATTIIDLTQLQSNVDNSNPSIIAAILILDDKTVFIKMTGKRAVLIAHRQKFEALCKSLRYDQ